MSVHDVAAVDHLNSLCKAKNSGDTESRRSIRSNKESPCQTYPIKDPKLDEETLRRAMARHQASLSRPESPLNSQSDDLPPRSHRYPSFRRQAPMSGWTSPSLRRDGYRTVTATGTTSSERMKSRVIPGLEGKQSALQNSQTFLDELYLNSVPSKSPSHTVSPSMLRGEGSPDDVPALSTSSYPYLSNSTYSLPRNHRLCKSNKKFADSLRVSQEPLFNSSRESLVPAGKSLLRRYPSSSLRSTPASSPDRYSEKLPSQQGLLRGNDSKDSSPIPIDMKQQRIQSSLKHQESILQNVFTSDPHSAYVNDSFHSSPSSAKSSRNNSPSERRNSKYNEGGHNYYRKSVPVSPVYSLRSSRAASPTDSWSSGRDISFQTGTLFSRRSTRISPSIAPLSRRNSQRSSRAASPAHSIKSASVESLSDYISHENQPSHLSSPGITRYEKSQQVNPLHEEQRRQHRLTSQSSSIRSSRAASPIIEINQKEATNLDSELNNLLLLKELKSNPLTEVIYVRETFKVVPATNVICSEDGTEVVETEKLPGCHLVKLSTEESQFVIKTLHKNGVSSQERSRSEDKLESNLTTNVDIQNIKQKYEEDKILKQMVNEPLNETDEKKASQIGNKSVEIDLKTSLNDDQEDMRSVGTQDSYKIDKATTVDISLEGIHNIEELLKSLSRRVRSVEQIDRGFAMSDCSVDNDDSARSESFVSLVSSTSAQRTEREQGRVINAGDHSLIRRQSVIIEGLTLETEELRKKCQELVTPVVEDLSHKLENVEEKLQKTESYCYQVVEENLELKSDIEGLESEISEVQDTFRDEDAKEFKKVKWELEKLSKTCRNLQIKLGKAQVKAIRLRHEKEEIENEQREQNLWKTSAVVAVAALAAYHFISKFK